MDNLIDKITFLDLISKKEYNSYDDFGFLIKDFIVSEATVKEEKIDIPGSSETLDFSSALSGDINYKARNINIILNKRRGNIFLEDYSRIQNAIHGKIMKIIHSKDRGFYWIGRINIGNFKPFDIVSEIQINCDVEPYKYEINSSGEDWLWDTFDFETAIINETKDLVVNGELELIIIGRRKKIVPKITCDNALKMNFNSATYNLSIGTQYVPDFEICEGENKVKFLGEGTVSIDYRGGSL